MAETKTHKFLPEIFRTDTNKKFLNATLDQLLTEPNFKKINGYIGRKFAPTYLTTDSYVKEDDTLRQNYQLEPSTVVFDSENNNVDFYSSYIDLINKIKHYGGNVSNHSRLFSNELYSYDGKFDFDKFVNFSQYYWFPDGPDPIVVSASGVPTEFTWAVTIDPITKEYKFNNGSGNQNLTLAYGGKYTFEVAAGGQFWIQTLPGTSGVDPQHPNTSTREILGVSNNGSAAGVVTFNIPQKNGQARYTNMPIVDSVDYATSVAYRDIQGNTTANIAALFNGLDGNPADYQNRKIIFVGSDIDDYYWTAALGDNSIVPNADRTKIWVVTVDQNDIITLIPTTTIATNEQVYVKAGTARSTFNYFVDYTGFYVKVPVITASRSVLYYQNGLDGTGYGAINIVDPGKSVLDPDNEIIGKINYTSPTGLVFSNGLKILFDNTALEPYANSEYYVEGVGVSIRLVPVADLVSPELADLNTLDYLTINRSSLDLNAWSRSNRWFHIDVLQTSATYNNQVLVLDQLKRASRPIIEFNADLKLFNYGAVANKPIDVLDTLITNAFTQIENKSTNNANYLTVTVDGQDLTLHDGDRVIFSSDTNIAVRQKVYDFNIVDVSETITSNTYIGILTAAADGDISENNNVIVKNVGKEYWFNGTTWIYSQQKEAVNQAPLFDVFDADGISYGDTNTYINTDFAGTKIFSYKQGTGANDSILGFPLSYRTFNNVGDIQFDNNFDSDTFTYLVSPITVSKKINLGYIHSTVDASAYSQKNIWIKVNEDSKQYQIIHHTADGVNNLFEIDIIPNPSLDLPNVKVLINSKNIDINNFALSQIGVRYAVLINPALLSAGDSVDILIYSDSVSKKGYYRVPTNLDNNSLNQTFESLTLGQLRNHLIALSTNSQRIVGIVPGSSNLRDINIKVQGGNILKHSAPVIYSNLFLVDQTLNFVDSVRLAQKEYSKLKNKILELSTQQSIDTDNISGALDTILRTINGVKNKNFPWYHSDMIPWGDNKTTLPPYTVLDPRIRAYELSAIFNPNELSNKAVLIYLTRTVNSVTTTELLVHGKDYEFSSTNPSFVISDLFNLLYDDILTVVEYSNTDGNYIPETPTKLGLYPKYVPDIYVDDTYALGPVTVIQGHDGSITPAFNDYRDQLLLEFERRIYNNIKQEFRNPELFKTIPGRFRVTDYSLTEFTNILSTNFLTWVGTNKLDYTTNTYFKSNNAWTWNYKRFKDCLTGDYLPGTWRAIFRYWYDTDRPHIAPWEMLGFVDKPDYWDDRYGPAPYTGGNLVLWTDLSLGYIHAGPRAGIDPVFARPGLLNVIPVDDSGELRSPEQFAVLDYKTDPTYLNTSYAIGDIGPVEAAWYRSSEYAFAVQMAMAIAKPALYFGTLMNVDRFYHSTRLDQYIVEGTNQHIVPTDVEVNGYVSDNVTYRTAGYINWISDYLKNLGIADPQFKIKKYLKNLNVQLSYKTAGFTDKKYIKMLAEQGSPNSTNNSIIIPDDNYKIQLYKSVPVNKISYSAVIIEKSQNGYTVSGYSITSPYFTIVPSLANNNTYSINVGKARGVIYKDYQKIRVRVPYGFEFNTQQQVVDFLVSYQRHLQSQGFAFIDYNTDLAAKQDWILSAKEFLTWSLQGWQPGSLLILSPVNTKITVKTTNTVVDEITNLPTGSKLLDPNFSVIKKTNFTVQREGNTFSVESVKNQTIAYAELNLVQYEHVIIFDNKTIFNDIIYSPDTGNRQYRIKFVGYKTADWTGALNPPGFIYNDPKVDEWQPGKDYKNGDLVSYKSSYYVALQNIVASEVFDVVYWKQINQSSIKTGLLPNFATSAKQFEAIYDLHNQLADENLNFYSSGITGFRERQYLTDLGLETETQNKFYQGYIKQKGTKNAITALAQAQLANISNEIEVYEEWAVRVGEYGAIDQNKFVEVALDEALITDNPATVEFISIGETPDASVSQSYTPIEVYQSSLSFTPTIFEEFSTSADNPGLPVAGYVNVDDVDAKVFDLTNFNSLNTLLDSIGSGYTIWTAKNFEGTWDVYRISDAKGQIVSIEYSIDNLATVTTNGTAHNLVVGDIIAFNNFDTRFDGFYQVYDTPTLTTFVIVLRENYTILRELKYISSSSIYFKLESLRINTPKDIETISPTRGWGNDDKVWVDNLDANNNWGVYNKTSPWIAESQILLNDSEYRGSDGFGYSLKLSKDAKTLFAGAPNTGSGRAAVFVKQSSQGNYEEIASLTWVQHSSIVNGADTVKGFGKAVGVNDEVLIVGAPDSNSSRGYVFTYKADPANGIIINQCIAVNGGSASDKFGTSISSSDDGNWLFVGAPGASKVYVYAREEVPVTYIDTFVAYTANSSTTGYTLTAGIASTATAEQLLVTGTTNYIPYVDYTYNSGTRNIVFTSAISDTILVTYQDHYKLVETLTKTDNFGISLQCTADGDQLIVGSSTTTIGGAFQNGKGYVYDRLIEGFIANGTSNTFIPNRTLSGISKVRLNGAIQKLTTEYTVVDNIVYLKEIPPAGSLVQIEINDFSLIQEIYSEETNDQQQFGATTAICPNSCTLYFGAPYYKLPGYSSGAVYRFTNQGRVYGTIIGSEIANPSSAVTIGHSIRINTVEIIFYETSLNYVVNTINSKGIAGIVAINDGNKLKISSTRKSQYNLLDILPGNGTAMTDLGLSVFVQTQLITYPSTSNTTNEVFGTTLKIGDDATTLAVSSSGASAEIYTTFDNSTTVFDGNSTGFAELIVNSGLVYIYTLMPNPFETIENPSQFAYVQQLNLGNIGQLDTNYNFGSAIDIRNNYITVGASNDNTIATAGGGVYGFQNVDGTTGWQLLRYNEPRMDPATLDKLYLYNKKTKVISTRIDHIDPAKGKLLGVAMQDLDFISELDPAVYSGVSVDYATSINYSSDFHWTNLQVGKTWWDTSQIRYIDYEQGDINYRSKHWGELFPGSVVKVYEWVESTVLPSQYVENGGNGIPKYANDSAFVEYTIVDSATGLFQTLYYYWVSDKTDVDFNKTRRSNSVKSLQQIIENPKDQGIPYAGILTAGSLALFNIERYLSGTDAVLHIDYSPQADYNIIHSEYQLLQEYSDNIPIPDRIINKLQDSLSGVDSTGLVVPDPKLTEALQVGIDIRPRQSIFANRPAALENFVNYVNTIMAQHPVAYAYNINTLTVGEEAPLANTGEWDIQIESKSILDYLLTESITDGYKSLVTSDSDHDGLWTIYEWQDRTNSWYLKRIQSFYTPLYWNFIDWYASDFDETIKTTYTVDHYYQIKTLVLSPGNTIKLNDNGEGKFVFYRVKDDLTLEQVGIQDGTIQLKSTLYDLVSGAMGFDADNFDTIRFDQTPNLEMRQIFDAVYNDIFIKELKIEFNNLFFNLVNYIFSEQNNSDWIMKTSFISVMHKIRELAQYPSYVKDNKTFYEDYINEVKPYRTIIREYIPTYNGIDYLHSGATDFDLQPYYDANTKTFRSPDGTSDDDALLYNNDEYIDWSNNHTYSIASLEIANGGTGFLFTPNVIITGGGGTGAVAHATINTSYGNIAHIEIVNPGSGYTSTPTVTINGNGEGAVLTPRLKNVFYSTAPTNSYNTVRNITTEIKFDRTDFYSNVADWQANTAYTANITVGSGTGNLWLSSGNLVSYNGELYHPFNANVTTESTFDRDLYQLVSPSNVLVRASQRVMGYYQPTAEMPTKTSPSLISGIEYPGVKVTGVKYDSFTSNVNLGTGIAFFSGNSSIVSTWANVDFTSLNYQLNQQLTVIGSNYNNEVFGIVDLTANTIIVDTGSITNESAGANVTFRYIDYNEITSVDSVIQSSYLDTALGTRPEDINIDGGAYVDTFNSHAPEELIPGRMFDTLEMKVFTANTSSFNANLYNIGRIVITNPGYGYDANTIQVSLNNTVFYPLINYSLDNRGRLATLTVDPLPGIGSCGVNVISNLAYTPTVTITGSNVVPATATLYVTPPTSYDLLGYRIFQDMNGNVQYTRLSGAAITTLSANLNLTDSNISVADASVLPDPNPELGHPGIVYINGEKITYYTRDTTNNVIGQLRRSVDGTGAANLHIAGSKVVDGSLQQQLTVGNVHYTTWLNMTANVADGQGLAASTTDQVNFLKESASYIP